MAIAVPTAMKQAASESQGGVEPLTTGFAGQPLALKVQVPETLSTPPRREGGVDRCSRSRETSGF